MAARNHTRIKNETAEKLNALVVRMTDLADVLTAHPARDGRALAVDLLCDVQVHAQAWRARECRTVLQDGLAEFAELPKREQQRFVAVLADYLAGEFNGTSTDPKNYRRSRLEVHGLAACTKAQRALRTATSGSIAAGIVGLRPGSQ